MTDLDRRLQALAEAVELADGRLDPDAVQETRAVVARAGKRLGLGVETTVAVLAGPTGAGKSSLFNALVGAEVARVSRRRPTTAVTTAAIWGAVDDALLDWLEVRRRHRADGDFDGLVLLDLPDFDSVELDHRLEVDRIVELADLFVWVVDPQKYADAAWHERYLRPLAAHADVMAVALNQADLLTPDALTACRADLGRLLEREGLSGVPVLPLSARTGEGLEALRRLLGERVAARSAAVERLAADVDVAATTLVAECGDGRPGRIGREARERLVAALAEAAGVPTVVRAVGQAHRRRGGLATGWPFLRWLRRLRPDPLRRLRLPERPQAAARTSLPGPTPLQRAQVDGAARALATGTADGMPDPWPGLVRSAATAAEDRVADRLDRAVAGADLHVSSPRWWRVVGALQVLLALAVGAGAVWLLGLALLGYFQLADLVPVPEVGDLPLPTALVLGGVAAGLLLALVARIANRVGARRRARAARRALRRQVDQVATELVIRPVENELEVYERLSAALAAAAPRGHRPRVPRLRRDRPASVSARAARGQGVG